MSSKPASWRSRRVVRSGPSGRIAFSEPVTVAVK